MKRSSSISFLAFLGLGFFTAQTQHCPAFLWNKMENVFKEATSVDYIVVSLADQAFAAYSQGRRVMRGPIASGTASNPTPTGSFRVSNKHRHWVSTIYHVPMPYLLRLNGGAIGLHQGFLPGYPASHGCVRLTEADAEKLFGLATVGTRVSITSGSTPDTTGIKQPKYTPRYYRMVNGKKVILSESESARVHARKKSQHGKSR